MENVQEIIEITILLFFVVVLENPSHCSQKFKADYVIPENLLFWGSFASGAP